MEYPIFEKASKVRFIPQRALAFARKLAFPRLVGTEGEGTALSLIISEIESLGLPFQTQSFPLGPRPWSLYKISLFAGLLLVALAWWLQERGLVPFFLVLAFLPLTLWATRLWLAICRRMMRKGGQGPSSKNLLVSLPAGDSARPFQLFLLAHYDSKSQTFTLPTRIVLTAIMGASVALLALLFLLKGIGILPPAWVGPTITSLALIAGASILPFLFQRTGNKSPGALDNAAALGILIELLRYFKQSPPKNLHLTFLFVGAEEEGLQGSLAFLTQKEKELKRPRCRFINLDGVGAPGKLLVTAATGLLNPRSGGGLLSLLKDVSKETGVPLHSFPLLPGLIMDHIPFALKGYQAASLFGLGKATLKIHTPGDRPELLSISEMEKIGVLIVAAVERLNSICAKNLSSKEKYGRMAGQ